MLKQIFKNVISLSSFLYCRSCRCWVSQRLHSQAVCVLAIFIILCHDSLFQDRGEKSRVCLRTLAHLPERAPGTHISKLHVVNILKQSCRCGNIHVSVHDFKKEKMI